MAAKVSQTSTISKWTKAKLSMLNQDSKSTNNNKSINRFHQDNQSTKELMLTMFIQDQSEFKYSIKGFNTHYFT